MSGLIKKLFKGGAKDKPISYREAKKLARHGDPKVRRKLAAREDVKPEILYYLAEDSSPEVRRVIAGNEGAPRQVDLLLAGDSDEKVRTGLAEKIARLAPGLTAHERDNIRRMTHEALEILARDQVTLVRQILSEALKEVAHAPPEVINRLARDAELVVSGPILEFSPVLTDDDILDIVVSDPVNGVLAAVSRRAGVSEPIVDAIVEADDVAAVTELLANQSAQIREETLDMIIDRAPDVKQWHAPLVKRPKLPDKAALRLARFVADNLLEILTQREDLDPEIMDEVKTVVRRRLEEENRKSGNKRKAAGKGKKKRKISASRKTFFDEARRMHEEEMLGETTVADSLHTGDHEFAMASLAVLAGLPLKMVEKVVSAKSAKGLVALAWKAGLSMELAVQLQKMLARIPPKDILNTSDLTEFPYSEEEMRWQLDYLKEL